MRILCIASGGGHLEEMLACVDALKGHELAIAVYKFHRGFWDRRFVRHFRFFRGGDRGLGLLLGMLFSVLQWAWVFVTFRPHVLFSTGMELAIVPFWLGRLLFRTRCVYLETPSRKEGPSRTGPLVYPVSHAFFVQSKALLKYYGPKARYAGMIF